MSYKLTPAEELRVQSNAPNWAIVYNPVAGGVYFGTGNGKIGYSHSDRSSLKKENGPVNELTISEYNSWINHRDNIKIIPLIQENE